MGQTPYLNLSKHLLRSETTGVPEHDGPMKQSNSGNGTEIARSGPEDSLFSQLGEKSRNADSEQQGKHPIDHHSSWSAKVFGHGPGP